MSNTARPFIPAMIRPSTCMRLRSRSCAFVWQRHTKDATRQNTRVIRLALPSVQQNRYIWDNALTSAGTILIPPAVFVGLDKIIYMPSVPPFSRSEKLSDYTKACFPVVWREEIIKSSDGTRLALCIASNDANVAVTSRKPHVFVLYFQGNASSLPPRLPALSKVLRGPRDFSCTLVCLSYRGFWKSSGRASQKGIERDAAAALSYVRGLQGGFDTDTKFILWGQSIGAGVATTLAATTSASRNADSLDGLILETPFLSIKDMLISLYPQRWLPYRYLGPFLWNFWNSRSALKALARNRQPKILILTAGKDEVVPTDQSKQIVDLCRDLSFDIHHVEVPGALHTEVMARQEGSQEILRFLERIVSSSSERKLSKHEKNSHM